MVANIFGVSCSHYFAILGLFNKISKRVSVNTLLNVFNLSASESKFPTNQHCASPRSRLTDLACHTSAS